MNTARELWKRLETIRAVTYFAPESIDASQAVGLRGFWMGYFGFRAAPLGRVSPAVVEATFANFATPMVTRSIPDAWDFAEPEALVAARSDAAAAALRRLAPDVESLAARVNDTLLGVVAAGDPIGRPLFAANRDVARLDDPVAQLWQHCTTLREHRGDGHVNALAAAGVDGCQAHQLVIASQNLPVTVFRDNRGWTDDQWSDGARRLQERGLLHDEAMTVVGREMHEEIERNTDSLALEPFAAVLTSAETDGLVDELTAVAVEISASGVLPFPNPMALPRMAPS